MQPIVLAAAMHGGDMPPDPRELLDDWLGGEQRDGPDAELRRVLGV